MGQSPICRRHGRVKWWLSYTLAYLINFSKKKQVEWLNKQTEKANRQLERIENSGLYSQGYDRAMSDIGNGNRFRRVRKNASQFNIERQLVDVLNFMNSDSYYLKDIRANMKSIREELSEKGEIFNFKSQQEFNNFYKILHSNEFGRAQKEGILDSSIEMDEIKESLLKGATVDEILGALQDFATSELTVDEFQRLVDEQRIE